MNETKLKEFQSILHYLPAMGVSIAHMAKELNISMTSLYNYRNGAEPKQDKYAYILSSLYSKYPKEMSKINVLLDHEKELIKEEAIGNARPYRQ